MSEWHVDPTPYSLLVLAVGLLGIAVVFASPFPAAGIALFGLGGALISYHLYEDKKHKLRHVSCPIGENCVRVITSKYSKFLGVSVEIMGLLYYGFILAGYVAVLLPGVPTPGWFVYLLLVASGLAVLFSAYLTYIQAVPLGMWCVWCVTSAILSTLILVGAVTRLGPELFVVLGQFSPVSRAAYLLAVSAGLGVAISNDVLTTKFLADFRLSDLQSGVLKTLMELTWASLGLIALAGAYWIAPNATLLADPAIRVTLIALAAIVANGAAYHFYVSERMVDIYFEEGDADVADRGVRLVRRLAFVLSSVSVASWATILLLTFLEIPYGFGVLLAGYIGAVVLAALAGIGIETLILLRARGRFQHIISPITD